jgi:glycosyltransferase involved in cell wall biosynthesis
MAARRDDTARLVIAGSDMGRGRQLRRLATGLGLGPRTLFPGVLEGRDRLAALVDAGVVVYPSRDEIFGLVPLEALLCGAPVVVSDDCGCGEVIQRTGGGQVVGSGDVAAVSAAVDNVLGDPGAWREPVEQAAARVRELYAADAVAMQLKALYSLVAEIDATPGGNAR